MPEKELVAEQIHAVIGDEISLRIRLNEIANEYQQYGYPVERGKYASVQVSLPDGEIHFIPLDGSIIERVYGN